MSIGGIEVEGREAVAAEAVLDTTNVEGRSQWQLTWRRLRADRVAMTSTGARRFGRMSRNMMRNGPAPSDLAASMYSFSLIDKV